MSMNDTIADFLTRIRNAQRARLATTQTIHSNVNEKIALILKREGFIEGFDVKTDPDHQTKKTIEVKLRYSSNMSPIIQGLKRLSTPGRRLYATSKELEAGLKTFSTTIVSTPKGVIT